MGTRGTGFKSLVSDFTWGIRRGGDMLCKQVAEGSTPSSSTSVWVGAPGRADGFQNHRTGFKSSPARERSVPLNGRQPVLKTGVVVNSPRRSIRPRSSTENELVRAPAPVANRPGPSGLRFEYAVFLKRSCVRVARCRSAKSAT